jgi:3',5'-cyclic AMP phosphodiesterase CpdA
MNVKNSIYITIFFICLLIISSFTVNSFNKNYNNNVFKKENSDFYFIHMTDIHIMAESFANIYNGYSKDRFIKVLNEINSFENKPAFLVITGDLVEWGSGKSGSSNYETLVSFNWNLDNYQSYITNERKYIITYEDMTLFFLDSGPHYFKKPKYWLDVFARGLENEDIKWLEEKLNNCSSEYKIVLMHHPAINDRNSDGEMSNILLNNREVFIELCEKNDVDLVLTGHTHYSRVFDINENRYSDYPINASNYPTLFVQSKANKVDEKSYPDCNYRNISVINGNIWLEENVKVEYHSKFRNIEVPLRVSNILNSILFGILLYIY